MDTVTKRRNATSVRLQSLFHIIRLKAAAPYNERDVDHPDMIFVHLQSQFYLDVQDDSRSLSLPHFPDNIRLEFPTRTAFLDSTDDCDDVRPPGYPANLACCTYTFEE